MGRPGRFPPRPLAVAAGLLAETSRRGTGLLHGAGAHGPYLLAVAAAHGVFYRDYWTLRKFFTGSDFFQQFVPLLNFQSDCLQAGSLPLWNPYMNFGYPWVDHYVNTILFPPHLLLGLLTRFNLHLAQWEMLSWLLLGSLGVYWCCLELGASRGAAALCGILFGFSAQLSALPAWNNNVYNACSFPYVIAGYHRAQREGRCFSAVSPIFLALSFLGGNVAGAVLGSYLVALYVLADGALRRRLGSSCRFLGLTFAFSIALALPKILPLYLAMPFSPRFAFANTAENVNLGEIIGLYHLASCLLPVKHYFSLYVGALPVLAASYGLLSRKGRVDAALVTCLLGALLLMHHADGEPTLVRRAANAVLPFLRPVRQEFTFWYYPTALALLHLSRPIDALLSDPMPKRLWAAGALVLAATGAAFAALYSVRLHWAAMTAQAVVLLAWAVLLTVSWPQARRLLPLGLLALATLEMAVVFERVNVDSPPARHADALTVNVTHQWHTSPSFRDDELVRETWPITITRDDLRPTMEGSTQRPLLVPVTPGDQHPNWAEAMNQKLFLGWWYNTQERTEFVELMRRGYLEGLEGAPLFALFRAASGDLQPGAELRELTCESASFRVASDEPSRFLLHQMHDERWSAAVNGAPVTIARVNDYFMGLELPPGDHRIRLTFSDRRFRAALVISGAACLALAAHLATGVLRQARAAALGSREAPRDRPEPPGGMATA